MPKQTKKPDSQKLLKKALKRNYGDASLYETFARSKEIEEEQRKEEQKTKCCSII